MRRALKWTGIVLGSLVGLVVLVLGVVYSLTEIRIRKSYEVPISAFTVHNSPEIVAQGRHIAVIRGCVDCHAASFGGEIFIDEPAIGRLFASNLTSGEGGIARSYTDADWDRAIRHGIGPDGRPLLFMPSHEFYPLSDEDLNALVAYLKSLPPVDNRPVKNRLGPLGRALFLAGQIPLLPAELIDHYGTRPPAPPPGATVEYGAYLGTGCIGCHGDGYSGGKIPGAPPHFPTPTNITPDPETGIGNWTEADFVRSMREGRRPDGSEIDPFMPWQNFAQMTDMELQALYLYLQSLPPTKFGNR